MNPEGGLLILVESVRGDGREGFNIIRKARDHLLAKHINRVKEEAIVDGDSPDHLHHIESSSSSAKRHGANNKKNRNSKDEAVDFHGPGNILNK